MITAAEVRTLIAKSNPDTDAGFQAHRQLENIRYDLRCDDGRARQGLGLAEHPPKIEPAALELLDEYLSEH